MKLLSAVVCMALTLLAGSSALAAGQVNPTFKRGDLATPVTDATAHFGCELRAWNAPRLACYGPAAIRSAYGLASVLNAGFDGTGQTIVIIDAYGSPTIDADLATFDTLFGVPAPPSFRQIRMPGTLPFDYTDGNQIGWAEETSLDVQWSHAIAPGAKIVLVIAATNNDSDILDAQNYAIKNHLGHIISESFGESEYDLLLNPVGVQNIKDNERSYARARDNNISVFVSSGDSGVAETDANGNPVYPFPIANYPASSPNVTTVGGTNLFFGTATNADPNGTYQFEQVWNDGFGAGGGGISGTFATPGFQTRNLSDSLLESFGGHRGYPDIAYNAGVEGGVIAFLGFLGGSSGFYIFGGTSAGAPQWAGLTALANQVAGHHLGNLNNRLYRLGKQGFLNTHAHDVTLGDNGFAGIAGYPATAGWDLSTGWGTPNTGLVWLLATEEDD